MTAEPSDEDRVRSAVRSRYAAAALGEPPAALPTVSDPCCGAEGAACGESGCGSSADYSAEELARLPPGAYLGLGCGNPTGLADLRSGEVVVDLGSGGGVDCFLAAERVGESGHVIGVDMTPEMIARARENARTSGRANVEFRLGEIEHLPVADATADVVLSNCVINLALDKRQVYREAFRVLRAGGRLVVADVLATRPISADVRADPDRWSSCSSGALTVSQTEAVLRDAGFSSVEVSVVAGREPEPSLAGQAEIGVVPGTIRASKPPPR